VSVLITVSGIPVYSTIKEALAWSKRNEEWVNTLDEAGTVHAHRLDNGFGYMGGTIDMEWSTNNTQVTEIPQITGTPQDVTDLGSDAGGDSGSNGEVY